MPLSRDRIACLDGLRALSIMLVVLGHVAGTRGYPLRENMFSGSLALVGVRAFFVISGFLITGLLVAELRDTSRIRLDRFYFRRTLRIFVPYYAFLTAIVVLDRLGVVLVPSTDLAFAASYATNYDNHAAWQVAHTWSLSVEEQFYLIWPAVLAMLGARRALWAAALVVVAVPLVRLGQWQLGAQIGIGHRFETCADALATGCLLAGIRPWLHEWPRYVAALRSPAAAAIAACVVVATIMLDGHPREAFAIGWPVQNVGVALLIDHCLSQSRGGLAALVSARPLVAIGRMSYSIYLWQQLFLDRASVAIQTAFPVNLVAVAMCATASYYAVELGAMRLRQWLEPKLFAGRAVAEPFTAACALGARRR